MEHEIEEIFIEEEKESPFKKIFVIVIAVFLILMFVSYIGIGYGVGDIIGGLAESDLITDNVVEVDDFHIVFEDKPLEGLNEMYENNREVEFKICLGGEIVGRMMLGDLTRHCDGSYDPLSASWRRAKSRPLRPGQNGSKRIRPAGCSAGTAART